MNDLLRNLMAAADDEGRSFDHAARADWPLGAVETLQAMGILRPAAGSLHATCPNCAEGHVESVTVVPQPDGSSRFVISCPEALRVEIGPEMCEAWEIDPAGLAGAVSAALGLAGRPREVVPGRLWRLGRAPWPPGAAGTREVVLVRWMGDGDAPAVASRVGYGGRAIVLVPHLLPDERVWQEAVPGVVALSQVLTWADRLVIDVEAVVEAVRTADQRARAMQAITLAPESKKMVRRQVKAEIKSLLTSDAMVAAYREYGSYRKAADALTAQTGQPVTKDRVRRAVERSGGAAATVAYDDSASVARTVASQRRDRAKKIVERR